METLIVDGEYGMTSKYFADGMRRRGAQMDSRAPRQLARFIERRGAMLRRALRATERQLEREITANFDFTLAHAIFAGNALTH
eukprot:1160330-Pyramimonas_sp.AAC.1